jgi:hypothetical protein
MASMFVIRANSVTRRSLQCERNAVILSDGTVILSDGTVILSEAKDLAGSDASLRSA